MFHSLVQENLKPHWDMMRKCEGGIQIDKSRETNIRSEHLGVFTHQRGAILVCVCAAL